MQSRTDEPDQQHTRRQGGRRPSLKAVSHAQRPLSPPRSHVMLKEVLRNNTVNRQDYCPLKQSEFTIQGKEEIVVNQQSRMQSALSDSRGNPALQSREQATLHVPVTASSLTTCGIEELHRRGSKVSSRARPQSADIGRSFSWRLLHANAGSPGASDMSSSTTRSSLARQRTPTPTQADNRDSDNMNDSVSNRDRDALAARPQSAYGLRQKPRWQSPGHKNEPVSCNSRNPRFDLHTSEPARFAAVTEPQQEFISTMPEVGKTPKAAKFLLQLPDDADAVIDSSTAIRYLRWRGSVLKTETDAQQPSFPGAARQQTDTSRKHKVEPFFRTGVPDSSGDSMDSTMAMYKPHKTQNWMHNFFSAYEVIQQRRRGMEAAAAAAKRAVELMDAASRKHIQTVHTSVAKHTPVSYFRRLSDLELVSQPFEDFKQAMSTIENVKKQIISEIRDINEAEDVELDRKVQASFMKTYLSQFNGLCKSAQGNMSEDVHLLNQSQLLERDLEHLKLHSPFSRVLSKSHGGPKSLSRLRPHHNRQQQSDEFD
eukprot:GILJ01014685.1.p1 GENE.GILJ01014685.1~~GILJ01014685.1.p1  ORF type:complete len:540 (-),score=59.85 GILJ01014685.1:68-1687(-)